MTHHCSAPKTGHATANGRRKCPVHGGPLHASDRAAIENALGSMSRPVRRVAEDPHELPEILAVLAESTEYGPREGVASNVGAPPETLRLLAADHDATVRWFVAGNPSTPGDVLLVLARDSANTVRAAVAQNPKAPMEALTRLIAWSEDYWILRAMVASNPVTHGSLLPQLARDPELEVRRAATKAIAVRFARLRVHDNNAGAKEYLLEQAWWDMAPGDPAVVLALALYPNP